ncbi:hypothetical protein [Flavobacterium soli]|uniref:hypothetical protein n=1 Tax=Flavobacterium soli TaxID=344881 RepID=UPI00047B2E0E|nr:hypothetical protein [Flavobacterium soli]
MKKLLWIFFLVPLMVYSQDTKDDHFCLGIQWGGYSNFGDWKENGINFGFELAYKKNNLYYSAVFTAGIGVSVNKFSRDAYFQGLAEVDLFVGKKYKVLPKASVMPQIGVGFLHYTNHFQEEPQNAIGLPIQVKLLFYESRKFGIGIIPKAFFNKVQNNYSLNLTAQFNL